MNKYISDIIPVEDIKNWKPGDKIIINAPTGTGKSHFITHKLYEYTKTVNGKILLLTNRTILKEQIESDVGRSRNIIVMNYQNLTKRLVETGFDISKFTYVVCDECHFFFTDSYFNSETDIPLEYLTNLENNITLYLSATCDVFKTYMKDKNATFYGLDTQLHYDKLFYFKDRKTVVRLLESIPKDEKVIYFCSNVENAYKLHKQFETESSFICSTNNKKYKNLSNDATRQEIIKESKFNSKMLFTTKILDNGVNIKDESLKHIIIDIFDFDTIQQCIGRKRILNQNDKINVYIRLFMQNSVQSYLNQWNKVAKYAENYIEMGSNDYTKYYGRQNNNGIVYPTVNSCNQTVMKLNEAYYYKLRYDIQDCETITEYNKNSCERFGHLSILANRYGIQLSEFQSLETVVTTDTFNEQLQQFEDVKMFKDERKQFKDFIKAHAVKTVVGSHGSLGINTINGYFSDNKISYRVESFRETTGDMKFKTYWKLFAMI